MTTTTYSFDTPEQQKALAQVRDFLQRGVFVGRGGLADLLDSAFLEYLTTTSDCRRENEEFDRLFERIDEGLREIDNASLQARLSNDHDNLRHAHYLTMGAVRKAVFNLFFALLSRWLCGRLGVQAAESGRKGKGKASTA